MRRATSTGCREEKYFLCAAADVQQINLSAMVHTREISIMMQRHLTCLRKKYKQKNIRPRPDISKNPHFNFTSKLKNREVQPTSQFTTPVDLVSLLLFDKICLGLDICTSFLLV